MFLVVIFFLSFSTGLPIAKKLPKGALVKLALVSTSTIWYALTAGFFDEHIQKNEGTDNPLNKQTAKRPTNKFPETSV